MNNERVKHLGFGLAVFALLAVPTAARAQAPQLVRATSGPSGKTVGSDFVLDETRNRFVFPQDRTVMVYFQWDAAPGDHAMTATWTRPDGRVAMVSPDVKVQTTTRELKSYWIFSISQEIPPGAWTVSVRINGQPAGSHSFELAGVGMPERFTLDRVSKTYGPAIATISRLDSQGRKVDSGFGFVIAPGAVATAFETVDGASRLELEFTDGRRAQSSTLLAFSRLDDWAVVKADTAAIAPVRRAVTSEVPVGSRLATFNLDAGTMVIVPVDVGAVTVPAGYAARIRFAPGVAPGAVGGPLVDEQGLVVGIVGGSLVPGVRVDQRVVAEMPGRLRIVGSDVSAGATSIAGLPANFAGTERTLAELETGGALTPIVKAMPEFLRGGITSQLPKDAATSPGADETEFSARAASAISVYTYWLKHGKLGKGEITVKIYSTANQLQTASPPKKMSLNSVVQRHAATFTSKSLTPGYYRIDVCWDGAAVWRSFIRITD